MKIEETAERIGRLARDLCPFKPLGEEVRFASGISAFAAEHGYIPVVPSKSNCKNSWDYDKELYKQRN